MIDQGVFQGLFGLVPTKQQQRMVDIADSAIKTYIKVGVEAATFEKIAKTCKLSRPLILHYFPDYESLFLFVAKYIRITFQQFVISKVAQKQTLHDQLIAYVSACFDWTEEFTFHSQVWGLFYFYCATKPKFKEFNTDLVKMGSQRLDGLIANGNKVGDFDCPNSSLAGRQIQIQITGALISMTTESTGFNSNLKQETIDLCLALVRDKTK